MANKLSDFDLIVKARQGDVLAYTTLHNRYDHYARALVRNLVYASATSYVSEEELILTCSEVFVNCFRNYVGEGDNFYPYWRESALHAIKKEMKDSRDYYSLHETSFDEEDFYGRPNAEKYGSVDNSINDNIVIQEINKVIENNYPHFTKMERKVFLRKYRHGESSIEVAETLKISISSVNRHYKSALRKFASFMKEHY